MFEGKVAKLVIFPRRGIRKCKETPAMVLVDSQLLYQSSCASDGVRYTGAGAIDMGEDYC